MTYKINIEKRAAKKLENIDEPDYKRIKSAVLNLANNPRPVGYKKLRNREAYRITVGNYRIIYEIINDILLVNVITLGHRKNVYRNI